MRLLIFAAGVIATTLSGCGNPTPKVAATLNESASLSGDLPINPLKWKIITSMVDKKNSTMSTLYGNDVAVRYARTNAQKNYPEGSTLALVTWTESDDPRWFGAKIPEHVKSVEFVFVKLNPEGKVSYTYQKYEGSPLKMISLEQSFTPREEADILLSQRAAVLP
jgi:Cytochrome P460